MAEAIGCIMRLSTILTASGAAALMLAPSLAMADDWVATKLRGRVLQLVGKEWQPLGRGEIVSDDRVVRTIKGAKVTFQRRNETIELGGDTQIQIRDKSGRRFTTVQQYFGTVSIEADVREVQHFSVTTPHLAAVVKGTKFTVVSDDKGAKVSVQRGHVEVEDSDTHQSTLLAVGQSAQTSDGTPLAVGGKGELPTIFAANGKPVTPESAKPGKAVDLSQTPKAAAAAAREAALAAGASKREADQAAKAAEREVKAAEKEVKSPGKGSDGGDKSQDHGGKGPAGNSGKSADGPASDGNRGADKSDHGGPDRGNAGGGGHGPGENSSSGGGGSPSDGGGPSGNGSGGQGGDGGPAGSGGPGGGGGSGGGHGHG